jgi:periplasmic divalent cation tolerance protein
MTSKDKHLLVMVTAPNLVTARRLARAALTARLVACVNLVSGVESHFWWQDKIDTGREILMFLKTTDGSIALLEELILAKHPYNTPEFVVFPIARGNRRYLDWITGSLRVAGRNDSARVRRRAQRKRTSG